MATILIVDDDRAIVRFVKTLFISEGLEVSEAYSGEEGLELLEDGPSWPDIILLDLAMPGMNGREFFHKARCAGYSGPVLFCSAFGASAANAELGGQGAIEKPFDPDDLVASVRSQLVS